MTPEEATKAWQQEFDKLPKERQVAVQQWYAVQAYTAEQLGLPVEEWMSYVQWAMAHPLDFSFLADFPEAAAALAAQDGFERGGDNKAAALIGSRPETIPSTEQPKSGKSLFRIMLGRDEPNESNESNDS